MTATLQRLHFLVGNPLTDYVEGNKTYQDLSNELSQKKADFYRPLVRVHPVLNLEYSVLCTRLAHSFARKKSASELFTEEDKEALAQQLVTALVMAELLTHIYCYYLVVPREVLRLQKEQEVYRTLLGPAYENQQRHSMEASSAFSQRIREQTAWWNWPRLFSVRTRRVLTTLMPVVKSAETYSHLIGFIDQFASPFFNYLAWIFYVPRLTANIFLLLMHLVPGPWMDEAEKELGVLIRLEAQLLRRWFELGNDTAWLTTGLLCCFWLTGGLSAVGMYLTISIFFFDVLMASLRAYLELSRLKKLQAEYAQIEQTMIDEGASPEKLNEIREFQQYLQQRYDFEQKRLLISVVSTTCLFLAMCTALPILALSPSIIMLGAILVLLTTLATFLAVRYIEQQRPKDRVLDLADEKESLFANSPHVMFQPAPSERKDSRRLFSAPEFPILEEAFPESYTPSSGLI